MTSLNKDGLNWQNGEARSSLGNLYEVASLGGSVWQVRWNGTALTGWHSTQAEARSEAERHHLAALASQHPHHQGDPCVKCGIPHDAVSAGPCRASSRPVHEAGEVVAPKVFCAKLSTGVCDLPERVDALTRERANLIETKRDQFDRLQSALEASQARIAELEGKLTAANRRAIDHQYMGWAYRSMLGEKGIKVADMWDAKGVKRVHHSWGPAAAKMTGEERAQVLLDFEAAPSTLIENIDDPEALHHK